MGKRPIIPRGVCPLLALGNGLVTEFRRLGLSHHVAQRRLLVLTAGRLYGARRQHRAYPRREVPFAATGAGACWRATRLLPVDLDPALGICPDCLSLGLSRERQTVAGRRSVDAAGR